MTYYGDEAFPALSDEQWARLQAYGSAQEVESGALLFGVGEATHDLILVDSGEAEVVRATTARAAEAVVAGFGAGQFVGELGLLTGQVTYLSGWVSQPGQVHRISPVSFRQLMDEDPDLSDVILRALMARRRYLRAGEAARSIEILGSEMSAGRSHCAPTPPGSSCLIRGSRSTCRLARRSPAPLPLPAVIFRW
jgi:thioredoxin reductase (NADPH)